MTSALFGASTPRGLCSHSINAMPCIAVALPKEIGQTLQHYKIWSLRPAHLLKDYQTLIYSASRMKLFYNTMHVEHDATLFAIRISSATVSFLHVSNRRRRTAG